LQEGRDRTVLTLESVTSGYGDFTVLRDVDLTVRRGEIVALLGPNGAGKTTLLRTATGFIRPTAGRVTLDDRDLTGAAPHVFSRRGLCHLPEGRGIFPSLSVKDNLIVQIGSRGGSEAIAEAAELFPVLGKRLHQVAGTLSGGEQQMLALCRAYLTDPRVVLVDEASLGLAPLVVNQIFDHLARLVEKDLAVVIVEQYAQRALELADTVCVLGRGRIIHTGRAGDITPDEVYEKYLGVGT
jgi:branched-chain amino acid transport system ATP-binding protein